MPGQVSVTHSFMLRVVDMYCLYTKSYKAGKQPCSQALSSSSLVTGRKTLVAAGHITTQNLVKKSVGWEGWHVMIVSMTYWIKVKPADQCLECLNLKLIYFLLCAFFWMLKMFLSHRQLAVYSDLNLIYSNSKWLTVLLTLACTYISCAWGFCKFIWRHFLSIVKNYKVNKLKSVFHVSVL